MKTDDGFTVRVGHVGPRRVRLSNIASGCSRHFPLRRRAGAIGQCFRPVFDTVAPTAKGAPVSLKR